MSNCSSVDVLGRKSRSCLGLACLYRRVLVILVLALLMMYYNHFITAPSKCTLFISELQPLQIKTPLYFINKFYGYYF